MFSHVVAEVTIGERERLFASKDWQRRAVLAAAMRRVRRAKPVPAVRIGLWRPLVSRPEGGVQ